MFCRSRYSLILWEAPHLSQKVKIHNKQLNWHFTPGIFRTVASLSASHFSLICLPTVFQNKSFSGKSCGKKLKFSITALFTFNLSHFQTNWHCVKDVMAAFCYNQQQKKSVVNFAAVCKETDTSSKGSRLTWGFEFGQNWIQALKQMLIFRWTFCEKNIMIWGCYHSSIVLVQGLAVDIQLVEIVLFICWSAHRLPLSFCYAMTGLNSFTADTSISCLINLR